MAKIQTIKNKDNTIIYPQTHTQAVYDAKGKKLQEWMNEYLTTEDESAIENVNTSFEIQGNKTTVLDSNSTDIQYPAAKTVYDFVTQSIGEVAGQLKIEIVDLLPGTGENSVIYLVLSEDSEEQNIYNEYLYLNNKWELIGTTKVDLSDYLMTTIADEKYAKLSLYSDTAINLGRKTNSKVGNYSTAIGKNTISVGEGASAEGYNTKALGYHSHAEGNTTETRLRGAHSEGINNIAGGVAAHTEGGSESSLVWSLDTNLKLTGAENATTYKITMSDGSEPTSTVLQYFYARKGWAITADLDGKDFSFPQPVAIILGSSYDASTTPIKYYVTLSNTLCSESINEVSFYITDISSIANGDYSHIEGLGTKTMSLAQHVQGQFNILDLKGSDIEKGTYAHIVGNGTAHDNRSNAHTLDWNGNAWYQGDVYVGSTSGTNKDSGSKKLATEEYTDNKITYGTTTLEDGVSELATGTLYVVYEE